MRSENGTVKSETDAASGSEVREKKDGSGCQSVTRKKRKKTIHLFDEKRERLDEKCRAGE